MASGIDLLVQLIHSKSQDKWGERNAEAFKALFGTSSGRYRQDAQATVTLRAPEISSDTGVPFAAYIHPSNPPSGPYSGFSFVIFPVPDDVCMVAMVVGTQGLSPDEAILGRPGHARRMQAICAWLNGTYGRGRQVAWAKQDPTRVDLKAPETVRKIWPAYQRVFERYGEVLYAVYIPTDDQAATREAVTALLDATFDERGHQPLVSSKADAEAIKARWFEHLMPSSTSEQVADVLGRRRYVILQGPPGTGKTRMARQLLREEYGGHGRSIQFHANTTYENFVGGLAPVHGDGSLGFRFAPTPGFLMQAAAEALKNPSQKYLLHIDEINRADLGKVLGEAIFLLEPEPESQREIALPYDFGEPFHKTLRLPQNLHILGTMNSADRSIAIVDVAVRRRFAFLSLWPSMKVVEEYGCELAQREFRELVSIFVEHASEDALPLVPGHSYFLGRDEETAKSNLRTNLAPLLAEYLAQGYVAGFADAIRSYMQRLGSL